MLEKRHSSLGRLGGYYVVASSSSLCHLFAYSIGGIYIPRQARKPSSSRAATASTMAYQLVTPKENVANRAPGR